MKIGIPAETKTGEGRVALTPHAVQQLVDAGESVYIQSGAGIASGYEDAQYAQSGACMTDSAAGLYARSELIIKVKEPQPQELALLQPRHTLFCYLHLAAYPELTRQLQQIGLTAIGFETVAETVGGSLPLLAPMSEIAGAIAVHTGAAFLQHHHGGRGILLCGATGAAPAHVLVLGAGVAGQAAARTAKAMGARVTVLDVRRSPLEQLLQSVPGIETGYSSDSLITQLLPQTDLLVGAVLIPGARAPKLVSSDQVSLMQCGSVVLDIAVDQGGCIETIHPTTWAEPDYLVGDVIHLGIANLPGAVPRTATQALSGALLPWVQRLLHGWEADPALRKAVNLHDGKLVLPALAQAFE